MTNLIEQYKDKWNEVSWEISSAKCAFYALLAFAEWQEKFIKASKTNKPVKMTFIYSIMIVSNALCTEFFISACRIREESRTKYSLPLLFKDVKRLDIMKSEDIKKIENLLIATKEIYGKFKKIRGRAVAHLQQPQNAILALRNKGITIEDVICYLENCSNMFGVLGKPINKEWNYNIRKEGKKIMQEFQSIFKCISPIPD
ncbi:hypothetical protein BMS3Bbin03_01162 [bacterium BMS3Bbin03]|nr:hypothetical protein BMS3Bbin03_01162 [bacterium BMS3Bbin03]